ncbi:unnamed protein product [Periconia digitata]|uniref:Rhodopsin domain-containing protein n=1 Tax=Periconia digitata TaxID=1303443 RepID=A0A9W4XQ05_9PLEO|nr:unnamed protein product [Periconia digitata]
MSSSSSTRLARKGKQLQAIAIVFLSLSWVFIALRVWTRTKLRPNFGWDDWIMILAGMLFSIYCASILYIEGQGGGLHVTGLQQLNDLTKWVIVSESAYVLTVLAIKISLAIFFKRIVVKQRHVRIIYTTVALTTVSSTAAFFYAIFRCGPDINNYATSQLENQCMSRTADRFCAYQHAAIGLLTDCVFVILPVPLLWSLNMERRSKIMVGVILFAATLGCICSAIRFRYVDGLTDVQNFFWAATNVSIWSTVEPGAGIMAGCAATLRPLLRLLFAKVQSIQSFSSKFSELRSSRQKGSAGSHYPGRQEPSHLKGDIEANRVECIDLQSAASKKNESTECILSGVSGPSTEVPVKLYSSRGSGSVEQSM